MKCLALHLLILAATLTASRCAENPPLLSVRIALPVRGTALGDSVERELVYPNFKGGIPFHFPVIITNLSDKPQRIAQEWCSEGYDALSFECTDESGKTQKAGKLGRDWSKNFYAWWTLQPAESVVINVFYTDTAIWTGFPRPPAHKSQTVTMRAVFEMKPFGRIVSEPLKIVFTNRND
jgi:hypothetical protein